MNSRFVLLIPNISIWWFLSFQCNKLYVVWCIESITNKFKFTFSSEQINYIKCEESKSNLMKLLFEFSSFRSIDILLKKNFKIMQRILSKFLRTRFRSNFCLSHQRSRSPVLCFITLSTDESWAIKRITYSFWLIIMYFSHNFFFVG